MLYTLLIYQAEEFIDNFTAAERAAALAAHRGLQERTKATGAFVIAPAQTGTHPRGRQTYGHSLIVSPWGEVLADGGEQPGVVLADLDLAEVDRARVAVPSLEHDRDFVAPTAARVTIKGAA